MTGTNGHAVIPVRPFPNGSANGSLLLTRPKRRPLVLICAPLVCLLLSPVLGIGLAIRSVSPEQLSWLPPMQMLQPLHTLASVGCVLTGICALYVLMSDALDARGSVLLRRSVTLIKTCSSQSFLKGSSSSNVVHLVHARHLAVAHASAGSTHR